MSEDEPIYFDSPAAFGRWLEEHHDHETEVWVGMWKKATGTQVMNWSQAVDEALCWGWIDGIAKRVDDERHKQRFTPRKPASNWSRVNVEKMATLIEEGRMRPAGLAAFEAREQADYTYETAPQELGPEYAARLAAAVEAVAFLERQIPSYRRSCAAWVMGAKQEATRERRLRQLIDCSARGEPVPPYKWAKLKP